MISNIEKPEVVKLKDFGFEEAGAKRGLISAFKNSLELIYNGKLIDSDVYKGLTEPEIDKLKNEKANEEEKLVSLMADIDSTRDRKEEVDIKMKTIRGYLEKYEIGNVDPSVGEVIEIFDKTKFIVSSIFLFLITVFIILFYVAVVFKALFINTQDIANSLTDGQWGVSLLPKWAEVKNAINGNPMVLFAPAIFFGFGYAIHTLLENKGKLKYIWITLVLFVTFALDYLLADQIHSKINEAKDLIGMPMSDKFKDILIVLIMGFVVYLIWSVIFHSWMSELNKRNIPNRLAKKIKSLKEESKNHQNEINSIKKQIEKIDKKVQNIQLSLEGKSIPISVIIQSLAEFTSGWITFLSNLSEDKREKRLKEVEDALTQFKKDRQINNLEYKITYED